MDQKQALVSLLLSMFSADELRRFLRYLPDGEALVAALPGVNASPAALAYETVDTLIRVDYLREPALWERLTAERPRRAAEIASVRALISRGDAQPTTFASPVPMAVPAAPASTFTILLVSASPDFKQRLRVDQEFRQIVDKLRATRYRDRLRLVQVQAARFEDLRTALMEHEPQVLHVSAHGEKDGSLHFEEKADGSNVVTKMKLLRLLSALGANLRIVVLNACYSAGIARDLAPSVGCSIGMSDTIRDGEAIEFSVALYETLAFGRSIQTAFDTAIAGLDENDVIPQLFPPADQDPDQKRRQSLISGASA